MTIEDDIAFLERVPSFAILGREALRIIAIGAESRYVHGGEVLFAIGEAADAGYVVQQGAFALRTETTRHVTATAIEPSTVIRVSRSLFLKVLEGFPEGARRLRDHIAARTDQAAGDMINLRATLEPRGSPRR